MNVFLFLGFGLVEVVETAEDPIIIDKYGLAFRKSI